MWLRLKIPVVCTQLLVTTANLSLREHRVAVGTAADSLRHLPLCALRPILDCASSKCFPLVPLIKIIWESCLWEHTGATGADYGFSFPEKSAVLADGSSDDDREALCSFAVLHDVRRFDLASISMFASFLTLCLATLNLYDRTGDLRRSYRRLLFQRMLCIRGAPEGETLRAINCRGTWAYEGCRLLCSQRCHRFHPSQLHKSFILSPLHRRLDWRTLRNITPVELGALLLYLVYNKRAYFLQPSVPPHPSDPAISASRLHEAVVGGARQGHLPMKSFEISKIFFLLASNTRMFVIVSLEVLIA